jgi:tetratricopeptide (TPR) repeat protein
MGFFDTSNDPLYALTQDNSAQKAQLAQYAIQAAAKYMQNNNYDGAIKEFKKALAFDSSNATAQEYLGKIYLSQNKNDEAIKIYKTFAQQQPLSVNAQVNLGNAYIQNKQFSEAEIAFKKAARMDPLNPVADYTLGQQYLSQKRYGEAEAQFKKVAAVAPRDGNVYYGLGMLYNQTGKTDLAIKNLKQALAFKPDFPAANFELGVAYGAAGESDKAAEQLKILKTKDATLAADLTRILNKPKIIAMDTSKSGGFVELMGPGTPLWALDPSLLAPDSSKVFSVDITFNNEMDIASVINPSNWSISRANSVDGGYYNSYMPVTSKEVKIPPIPVSVTYNAIDQKATIKFRVSQNAAGNATIDPSHLVFKFSGKDAAGRSMDITADEIDGYAVQNPF